MSVVTSSTAAAVANRLAASALANMPPEIANRRIILGALGGLSDHTTPLTRTCESLYSIAIRSRVSPRLENHPGAPKGAYAHSVGCPVPQLDDLIFATSMSAQGHSRRG